jgi:hypothetical protein
MRVMAWATDFEEGPLPGAPAREVVAELFGMVSDPIWFMRLSQAQQLVVLRHHCQEGGWNRVWPAVARFLHRSQTAGRITAVGRVVIERRMTAVSRGQVEDALGEVLAGVLLRLALQARRGPGEH